MRKEEKQQQQRTNKEDTKQINTKRNTFKHHKSTSRRYIPNSIPHHAMPPTVGSCAGCSAPNARSRPGAAAPWPARRIRPAAPARYNRPPGLGWAPQLEVGETVQPPGAGVKLGEMSNIHCLQAFADDFVTTSIEFGDF